MQSVRRRTVPRLSGFNLEKLDAFPKVPESFTVTTASGGTISIFSFILIVVLIVFEIKYYLSSQVRFQYTVDNDFDRKLKINVDITVAMPCDTIGADILDVTNQNAWTFGKLEEEPEYFTLTRLQQAHWETMKQVNLFIREQYHAIQDVLWKEGYTNIFRGLPIREKEPTVEPDGCRLHGSLVVNKVAGNFHVTAGKHIPSPIGHAHISVFLRDTEYNFSHRIEKFSFGDDALGIFDPLEGDEHIAKSNYQTFQYYIKVVPTEVTKRGNTINTYQYSVTQQNRVINHEAGSHGTPGIYFKYDMSSIKVKVTEEYQPFWHFLVRLCGIVGGVFATSGIVNGLTKFVVDVITCKYYRPHAIPNQLPATNISVQSFTESFSDSDISIVPLANAGNTLAQNSMHINAGYFPPTLDQTLPVVSENT